MSVRDGFDMLRWSNHLSKTLEAPFLLEWSHTAAADLRPDVSELRHRISSLRDHQAWKTPVGSKHRRQGSQQREQQLFGLEFENMATGMEMLYLDLYFQ